MTIMKRTLAVSAILLLACSLTAVAQNAPRHQIAQTAPRHQFANPLLDDVAAMTRAGLPDATIEAYIQARQARLSADVTADDLIRLRDSGVSSAVVSYLAGEAGLQDYRDPNPQQPRADATYDVNQDAGPPPDSGSDSYPVNVDTSSYPYWYGWGYGYPYAYGWYGYPYWYGWWGYPYAYYGYGHGHYYYGHGGHGHGGGHGGWHGGGHGGGGHGGHGGGHH